MNFEHESNRIVLYETNKKVLAEVTFPNIDQTTVNINHTFVDDSLRGQGVAAQLMEEVARQLRFQNKKAIPTCSYAVGWFSKRKENYSDILR